MAIITEDYVSLETAKLLKDKGFLKGVDLRMTQNLSFYDNIGLTHNLNKYYDSLIQDKIDFVVAPTLQMAMKWLREVHNIHITINYSAFLYGTRPYYWSINKMDTLPRANTQIQTSTNTHDYSFVHCETACEAAIKYCLENLI